MHAKNGLLAQYIKCKNLVPHSLTIDLLQQLTYPSTPNDFN